MELENTKPNPISHCSAAMLETWRMLEEPQDSLENVLRSDTLSWGVYSIHLANKIIKGRLDISL